MNEKMEKDAMKKLRESRRATIERARQTIKKQNNDIKKITQALKSCPRTVPEISESIQMPASQVMLYVAGLKKYGLLVEGPKADDYFKYELSKESMGE